MAFYRWGFKSPFDELARVQQEMSRLAQTFNNEYASAGSLPPVNVYDDGEAFHVRAEIAGINRDKLDISVAGDVLTLKAERDAEESEGSYHRRERTWDRFNRSLTLPDTVDVDNVAATYKDGILEITLPRAPEVRPRKVTIES